MGAEPIAANFEPSTPLDAQAIATEKLRRKRRNRCAEIQHAVSELAAEFDWMEEMIHDSDIPEEDRTLLQTVLDALKHVGRRTIAIEQQKDLCAPSGLGEANLSRCVKRCRHRKILRWVANGKSIDVGIFPPLRGFWVQDDGATPIERRNDGEQWADFIHKLESLEANQQPELFPVAYSVPVNGTCLGSKSAPASTEKPTCSASNLVLPFDGDSSGAPQSDLLQKQEPASPTDTGTGKTDQLLFGIGNGKQRSRAEMVSFALRACGPAYEGDEYQRNYFGKWFENSDFHPRAFWATALWMMSADKTGMDRPAHVFTKRYKAIRAQMRQESEARRARQAQTPVALPTTTPAPGSLLPGWEAKEHLRLALLDVKDGGTRADEYAAAHRAKQS